MDDTGKLIDWSRVLLNYMGIALRSSGNKKLAEIAIDQKDMETFGKIVNKLEQLEKLEQIKAEEDSNG